MPKMTCNGFSMFAQHIRPELESRLGRRINTHDGDLMQAAAPVWKGLPEDDRRMWKQRAKEYKRSEEFMERKKIVNRRKSPTRSAKASKEDTSASEYFPSGEDYDGSDVPFGVVVDQHQLPSLNMPSAAGHSSLLNSHSSRRHQQQYGHLFAVSAEPQDVKRAQDCKKLLDFFKKATGGTVDDVKRCRFLFISAQTHGPVDDDGTHLPAALSLYEFSLRDGVMDTYSCMVGPWTLSADSHQRAQFSADETHKLPVDQTLQLPEFTSQIKEVLTNILGRSEPGEAFKCGVRVGKYTDGLVEDDMHNGRGTFPLLPGDLQGRRWLICVDTEMPRIMSAIQFLSNKAGMEYIGFPTQEDRFIYLDTLIDTLSLFVSAQPKADYRSMLRALQMPGDTEASTLWDKRADMYCAYHKTELNRHCAVACARRACYLVFHALRDAYDLPFDDYRAN